LEFVHAGHPDASPKATASAVAAWEAKYGRFDFALTRTDLAFEAYFKKLAETPGSGWACVKRTATAAFYRRAG
jgi:hypothetical protein